MLRSYRCILVALVGWLSLAAGQQPREQSDRGNAAEQSKNSIASEPPYAAYPDKYAEACYGAQNHDTADLCAQWRAAIAAEKAAHEARRATNWSIAATALTLATVVGLIITIWQTFGALGEARRGNRLSMKANARATRQAVASANDTKEALRSAALNAEAATQQATIAEDTARRQLRAYVVPSELGFEWMFVVQAQGRLLYLWAVLKNAGGTPTRKLRINAACSSVCDDREQFALVPPAENDTVTLLPPGGVIRTPHVVLPEEHVIAAFKGEQQVFLYGVATYQDIFERERVTRFCYRVEFGKTPDAELPDSVRWHHFGPHNCADEECERT